MGREEAWVERTSGCHAVLPCSHANRVTWSRGSLLRHTASGRHGRVLVSPPCSVTDWETPGEAGPLQAGAEDVDAGACQSAVLPEQCASIADTIPIQPAFIVFSRSGITCCWMTGSQPPGS